MNNQFNTYTYIVNNQDGFSLSEALRLWKTKYKEFKDFERDVITHPGLYNFRDFVKEMWDDILPITVEEAFKIENIETRRNYFNCIGVETLFKQLNPKLLDRQVIKKKRARWDDTNTQYEHTFEDVYELYEIPGDKLFPKNISDRNISNPVFAVRCWCTTTNREYWIYVNHEAATGERWLRFDRSEENYDAIAAIAWTIRIDVKNPEKIYRQGDIIVVKHKENLEKTAPYHLTKEDYLNLMYSET